MREKINREKLHHHLRNNNYSQKMGHIDLKKLLLLVSLCVYTSALELPVLNKPALWAQFKNLFNRTYTSAEEGEHERIFHSTLARVLDQNFLYERNMSSFTLALNKFADIDRERRIMAMCNIKRRYDFPTAGDKGKTLYGLADKIAELPRRFDWRDFNFSTPVRDQGDCGSCWAITVAGALEAQNLWYNRKNEAYSPQELVDCSYKDQGCNGGWFETAFEYVASKPDPWLVPEDRYPYNGHQQRCDVSTRRSCDSGTNASYRLKCLGSRQLPRENEEALKEALIVNGPVAVAIHVTPDLYIYGGGVFSDRYCSKAALNHAVLLVGYGVDDRSGLPYWLLKNSWGAEWGESGFFRIQRGLNMCGVASYAVVPQIAAYTL